MYGSKARNLPGYFTALLWLVVMAAALYARPHLPVDETRYLAVAWEMWLRDDFLVPYLNGEPYSHKPPLLFWLMQAGWWVFGVNDWWPRFVAPLFGLGTLFLTIQMARSLWPHKVDTHDQAPAILFGSLFWVVFASLTMFDMMLTFCTLIALLGLLTAWRSGGVAGWLIFGFGIGLGALAKGPAILVHTLPVALFAPYWDVDGRIKTLDGNWRRWYLGVFCGVLLGAAIGLAWAIPAAIFGGDEYRDAIFIKQTAGRMVKSFAHQQPWYFFLAIIGPLLLPWTIWPRFWRSLGSLVGEHGNLGVRFCLVWLLPAFLVFSLISGKQPHYLLPEFPALALLFAYLFSVSAKGEKPWGIFAPVGFIVLVGIFVIAAPSLAGNKLPQWVAEINNWWGLAIILSGLVVLFLKQIDRVMTLAIAMTVLLAAGQLAFEPRFNSFYSMRPNGEALAKLENQGFTLFHFEKYHGQYQFAGHLKKPIRVVKGRDIEAWAEANPNSKII
ncbi:MAG: glycosyltransferase family 39 protein, partial [Alphaproteobacteria bacterium]|nr:glycosyltransferase family 39 protein [Alphaproteobacteria bacterium]